MFHIELRQFPHVARAFNLTEEELDARILRPWIGGSGVNFSERRWEAGRARLKVYEGPRLRTEQLGLGRGWAEVTRTGTEVTEALLSRAHASGRSALEQLSEQVLRQCTEKPIAFEEIEMLAGDRQAAEQAVLELLRDGHVRIVGP